MFTATGLEKDRYEVKDMCRLLGLKPPTIRKWDREGRFTFLHSLRNHRYLDRDGMIALMKQEGRLSTDFVYCSV